MYVMVSCRKEIKDYFVTYFNCFAAFKVPYRKLQLRWDSCMFCGCMNIENIHEERMGPSSMEVQQYSASNAAM